MVHGGGSIPLLVIASAITLGVNQHKEGIMPSIITAPVRTRNDSRGMTEAQVTEYIDLLEQAGEKEMVLVDDSSTDSYEKSYAKGERVRTAAKKFELVPEGMTIKVISFQDEDEQFVAALSLKKA